MNTPPFARVFVTLLVVAVAGFLVLGHGTGQVEAVTVTATPLSPSRILIESSDGSNLLMCPYVGEATDPCDLPEDNQDPVNLIFYGLSIEEVSQQLSTVGWRDVCALRSDLNAYAGPFPTLQSRDPDRQYFIDVSTPCYTDHYHVRLWAFGSWVIGAAHYDTGLIHHPGAPWDDAEARVRSAFEGGGYNVEPYSLVLQPRSVFRNYVNDGLATLITRSGGTPPGPTPAPTVPPGSTPPPSDDKLRCQGRAWNVVIREHDTQDTTPEWHNEQVVGCRGLDSGSLNDLGQVALSNGVNANDIISAVAVASGHSAKLCADANAGGECRTYSATTDFLGWDFDNRVSSVFVDGSSSDTTAPTSRSSVAGVTGLNGWFISDVTVTLNSDAPDLRSIEYRVADGGWTTYTEPFVISTEGRTAIEHRATDTAGNVEATQTLVVSIDKTPPESQAWITAPIDTNNIVRDTATITFDVVDEASGPDFVERSFDGGATWTPVPLGGSFQIAGPGVTEFLHRARDRAGLIESPKPSGLIVINSYVLFGNGPSSSPCPVMIRRVTTASITGSIHSNGCISITQNTGFKASGPISVVGTATVSGNTGSQVPTAIKTAAVPIIQYSLSQFRQIATQVYPGGTVFDSVDAPLEGVIYVTGTCYLDGVKVSGSLTLICERDIVDRSVNGAFKAADPTTGALLVAGRNVQLNSTGNVAVGLVYAPAGTITVRSTNFNLNGSLVGKIVKIDGATNFNLTYNAAFASTTRALPLATMGYSP